MTSERARSGRHAFQISILKLNSKLALVAAGLMAFPIQAFPQAAEPGTAPELELLREEESESISRGLAQERPISEAPSNVYVITDEDIRQSGAPDIPTVLRRIPGIEVMQTTGAHFDVSVRGDNQPRANKLLVLIDGRSFYLDVQGEVLWKMLPVTLPEIKRIEVLKGPASALYGFNAFDGVVNIITKSAAEMKGTTLQVAGGEFGTLITSGIQAGTFGKLGYRLSAGHEQTAQWRNRDSLAFRANRFNGQIAYQLLEDSKLSLSAGLVDSNRYEGPNVDLFQVTQKPQHAYTHLIYERPNFFIRAYWNRWNQEGPLGIRPDVSRFFRATDRDGNIVQLVEWDSYNIETQHAVKLWATNFTYGVNYRHNAASSSFLKNFTREDRLGLYIQDEWSPTRSLTVVGGVRYDMDTFINPTVSPRFSLIYNLAENHTFRAGVAVAYRPPTIFETNADTRGLVSFPGIPNPLPPPAFFVPPFTTSTELRGSDGLAPEQIVSYDAGYQGWYFKHRLRVRADLFFNHISDLIAQRSVPTGRIFTNGREADIYGGEAGIEFLATSWLTGFANYSYQEIHQTFTGTDQRGGPRFKANAGLRGDWENGLNGEVWVHYYGAATYPIDAAFFQFATFPGGVPPPNGRVGSYTLLNARAGYRFWRDRAEVAVAAFNALNDHHREHPLGEMLSSRVIGWLTIKN